MRISDWSSDVCSSDLTAAGLLAAKAAGPGRVTVDMGEARLGWTDLPLSDGRHTMHLGIGNGPLQDPVGVSRGNPPAVIFVSDVAVLRLEGLGPPLDPHALFPERTKVGQANGHIRKKCD